MKLNCIHWSDCGIHKGGCCAIGAHVRPTYSVCLTQCLQRQRKIAVVGVQALEKKQARTRSEQPHKNRFSTEEIKLIHAIDKASLDEGLGDTLHYYLETIGADKAAEFFTKITGIECGCLKRREWLNKWWPYSPKEHSSPT